MKALLMALMTFAAAETDLTAPDTTPDVRFKSERKIHYMAQPSVPYDGEPSYHGLHRSGYIFLAKPWSRDDAADRARLLHELVHYMQAISGEAYRCKGAKEREAYAVQRAYLRREGADSLCLTSVEVRHPQPMPLVSK